ncbi:zinc finger protein CONSTANS-LIKE 4-like [Zingiber officinale]|uniref:B box-type domain-containing protein n=1 Tax=Zingiber officinale TaxID=94328 RepID=A0A8J5LTQ7_ZINOF|nr:zinc finger protein CONSTANS-LIKE 4-like [Zingiber officinale]KAG6529938.1 hypothetical protein ZIOFF_012155 [Zingiber officinale]
MTTKIDRRMGSKQCELCDRPAMMRCESDQASLCWECDAKVHGANFLVARHSRCLLCRSCQSPTPWWAEGARLGHTVSVCERCAAEEGAEDCDRGGGGGSGAGRAGEKGEGEELARDLVEDEEVVDERDEGEEEQEGDDDDDGENQVVPWSLTPPPAVASSSSGGEEEQQQSPAANRGGSLKRMRENADLTVAQEDRIVRSASHPSYLASGSAPAFSAVDEVATSSPSALRPPRLLGLEEIQPSPASRRLRRAGSTSQDSPSFRSE